MGGLAKRQLLRGSLSVALLFAVHLGQLRARLRAAHWFVVEFVAGVFDSLGARRISCYLLLLPQGVLSIILSIAAGMRSARRSQELLWGDALPLSIAERPPLFFLSVFDHFGISLVGRAARLSLPRRFRHRHGNHRPYGQRGVALAV